MNYWDILLAQKLKKPDPLPDNAYLLEEATGDVITLTDAAALPMPTATTNLTPIQDLHGYSYPWVGGAGKNLLPMTIDGIKALNTTGVWSGNTYTLSNGIFELLTDSANNIIGITCNITGTTTTLLNLYSGDCSIYSNCILNGGNSSVAFIRLNSGGTIIDSLGTDANIGTLSTTGEIYIALYGSYGGTFYPMIRLATVTDPTFAPYTNICPISGYNSASYNRTGVNVWDEVVESGRINATTGENVEDASWIRSKNYIKVTPSTSYYFNVPTSYATGRMAIYDKNKNFVEWTTIPYNNTYTTNTNACFIRMTYQTTAYNNDISINYPNTITTYTPYQGQAVTLSFDNTIYSGVIDWCTGVVTVDKAINVYVGDNSENWVLWVQSDNVTSFQILNLPNVKVGGFVAMNMFKELTLEEVNTETGFLNYTDATLRTFMQNTLGITTLANWKTYLSNNNLQVLYELNTPITYQLTPTQLKTLAGYNTIYTDIGNITLQYFGKGVNA